MTTTANKIVILRVSSAPTTFTADTTVRDQITSVVSGRTTVTIGVAATAWTFTQDPDATERGYTITAEYAFKSTAVAAEFGGGTRTIAARLGGGSGSIAAIGLPVVTAAPLTATFGDVTGVNSVGQTITVLGGTSPIVVSYTLYITRASPLT